MSYCDVDSPSADSIYFLLSNYGNVVIPGRGTKTINPKENALWVVITPCAGSPNVRTSRENAPGRWDFFALEYCFSQVNIAPTASTPELCFFLCRCIVVWKAGIFLIFLEFLNPGLLHDNQWRLCPVVRTYFPSFSSPGS